MVVGASSLGKSAVQIARAQGAFELVGVIDDVVPPGTPIAGVSCLGPVEALRSYGSGLAELGIVIAIGNPRTRKRVLARLRDILPTLPLLTIVHPAVVLLGDVQLGPGCIVSPGCVVGPDVTIGTASVLNANVSIGAGARIGDFATLCPGANVGSEATLGTGVYIGMGAAVAQQVRLDDWSSLGALSFAREDIPTDATAFGAPARVKSRQ